MQSLIKAHILQKQKKKKKTTWKHKKIRKYQGIKLIKE